MNTIWKWTKRILSGLLILILVLMALMWLAGLSAKSKLAEQNPLPGEMIDMNGFKMHLYCAGEGSPTVILEAGLNDFYVSWTKVQPEVAKTTRVCSYDRAGLGWSEASPNPRASDVMAEELHVLLNNAGIAPPYVLVGHSFGGINVRRPPTTRTRAAGGAPQGGETGRKPVRARRSDPFRPADSMPPSADFPRRSFP